ncbi:hypothetical protein BGX38DRAFT_1217158, partial [Terfezia claveryi]
MEVSDAVRVPGSTCDPITYLGNICMQVILRAAPVRQNLHQYGSPYMALLRDCVRS